MDDTRDKEKVERHGGCDGNGAFPDISGRRRCGRHSLLQCNLNRSRRGIMLQSQVERRIRLAVVGELYSIPDASRGAGDLLGFVASCSMIEQGRGFVAVKWCDLTVVGVYVSPNISRAEYVPFLDGLAVCVRRLGAYPSLILGDFNAHSTAWGPAGPVEGGGLCRTGRLRLTTGLSIGYRPARAWRDGASS
jgi:hypothetical protein